MSLDSIVASLVQKSLNSLVNKNPQSQRCLFRLKNKKLCVYFSDIKKTLFFVFDKEIEVSTVCDKSDCCLTMALLMSPKLKDKTQLASLIKEDKLKIEGDIDVLQQFVSLLEEINIDVAQWLSYYTGDIVAHSLVTGTKSAFSKINSFTKKQQRYFSEVIIEEWKFTPSMLEIAYFVDSVGDLESKMLQFESRIKAFEHSLISRKK